MVNSLLQRVRRSKPPRAKQRKDGVQGSSLTPLTVSVTPTAYFAWKSLTDFSLALLLLVPGLPLMVIAFLVVRLSLWRPRAFPAVPRGTARREVLPL